MSPTHSKNRNPGCLGALFSPFRRESKPTDYKVETLPEDPEPFPYRVRDDFLSPAEHSFYLVLKEMMGVHFTICTKVSLADLFFVTRPNENRSAYNRINRKHVDFLICNPQTMKPLFALELDDSSHERADRITRDEFVDGVFEAAKLPLLHIPVRASYNTSELGVLFKQALHSSAKEPQPVPAPVQQTSNAAAQPPLCPKCGVPMVVRTAARGEQAGQKFYGCPNYPNCRVVIPVKEGAG